MWCRQCRQDVPAVLSAESKTLCCPRCGKAVCADVHVASAETPETPLPGIAQFPSLDGIAPTAGKLPWCDGWELDEQLRHIERVLHTAQASRWASEIANRDATDRRTTTRIDAAHAVGRNWHVSAACPSADEPNLRDDRNADSSVNMARKPMRHSSRSSRTFRIEKIAGGQTVYWTTWLAMALGTGSFVCGGILLGWSLATGRHESWNVGMSLTLAGEILLLAGLMLQIDRFWHHNRTMAAKLDHVDREFHELKDRLATNLGPAGNHAS